MATDENTSGWVSIAPGSLERLPEQERRRVEQAMAQRAAARGDLLAIVAVRVYERAEEPQVTFPAEARMGPDADPGEVAAVVARAAEVLERWR
jgi:hypothetical protein